MYEFLEYFNDCIYVIKQNLNKAIAVCREQLWSNYRLHKKNESSKISKTNIIIIKRCIGKRKKICNLIARIGWNTLQWQIQIQNGIWNKNLKYF